MITKKQNLMAAKTTNSTDIAEKGASSNPSDSPSNRKLMHACINRDVTMAKQAIMQGANINHRTINNITPLLVAAEHGDVDLIDLLCSQPNSIIDLQDITIYGSTPLHLAVLFGHKEAMQELLNRGALTNCCDNLGRYPLHFAAMHRNVEAARILLKFGAWVNVYDAFFESPLYYSVMRRPSVAMARLLLVNRASSDPPPNSLGMGLLLEAVLSVCTNSDFEAIKALIWSGGNVNVADPVAWRTPLHLVAINGHFELAEYLIRHGADLYAKNRSGQTPLEVAFNYRNLKIAYLIEESRKMQTTSYTSQILQSTEGSDEMCNRVR